MTLDQWAAPSLLRIDMQRMRELPMLVCLLVRGTSSCFSFSKFVLHLESARRSEELGYFQVQLYVHFTADQFPRRPACWATQICTVNALGFDIPSSRIYSAVPAPLISESWCHFVFLTFCLVWVRLVRDLLTSRHQQIPHRKSFHQTLSQHGSIFCLSAYVSICQHAMSQCLGFEC